MTEALNMNFLSHFSNLLISALILASLLSFSLNLYLLAILVSLRQIYHQQNQFLAHLAHRLKTPLACVLANLDMASLDLNEQHYPHLKISLFNSKVSLTQLSSLINNFLLSRKLAKTNQPEMADFNLSQNLKQTCQNFQSLLGSRKLKVKIEPNLIFRGNESQITELVVNLLDNATKFTDPKNGKIFINCQQVNQSLVLTVTDNGIGIAPKNLARIFQPYFQIKPAKASCGLGLALVQKITQLHQGQVQVESQLNIGTTLRIILPLQVEKLAISWWKVFLKVFTRAVKLNFHLFR